MATSARSARRPLLPALLVPLLLAMPGIALTAGGKADATEVTEVTKAVKAANAANAANELVPLATGVPQALSAPAPLGSRMRLDRFALDSTRAVALDLEAFSPFTPDATIVEHSALGTRMLPPPADQYWRGTVEGEPGSLVVFASGESVRGFIVVGEKIFVVAPPVDAYSQAAARSSTAVRAVDLAALGLPPFRCGADELESPPRAGAAAGAFAATAPRPLSNTVYDTRLAIETDYELYLKLGSSSALTTYVGDLVAAASAIYLRDLKVTQSIAVLHVYTTSADPWTQTSTLSQLLELGDTWHANYSGVARSTVHLLSGRSLGGGIAWLGTTCRSDFLCSGGSCGTSQADGHYGGGYGVSANLNGTFSTTSPSLFWDILCFAHEVGHNFNSPHTHCYSPKVDTCCPCEPATAADCVGPVPPEKGTIMSYCHLVAPGYFSNTRLLFGAAGETSQAVTTLVRSFIETSATCLPAGMTVTSILPDAGSTAGLTPVTIRGTGFLSGATATIGGTALTGVAVPDSATLTGTTGAHATGTADVVVTNPGGQPAMLAAGYFYAPPPSPTRFYALPPCRALDTRNLPGSPQSGPALTAGEVRSFPVTATGAGTCGVPDTAVAVSANVTVTQPGAAGELRVFPGNDVVPLTTSLAFKAAQTRANNAMVYLSTVTDVSGHRTIKVKNASAASVHVIVDVSGYYQ